ncbi:MAG: hypothetical protein PUE71_05125 [Clostridia bacterium]|nr:hypothetical protein [Clostridia bacterium]
MLYLRPDGGLCNRLRAIASSYQLVKENNDQLFVYWSVNNALKCRFENLFNLTAPIKIRNFPIIIGTLAIKSTTFDKRYTNCNTQQEQEQFLSDYKNYNNESYFLSTYSNYYHSTDYTWLKPTDILQDRINQITANFGSHCIGLHIRRTDNTDAIKNSPLELFQNAIEQELSIDPNVKFYLATDDYNTKNILTTSYPNKIIVLNMIAANRISQQGMQDAIVDLYSLAATDKIYGSYWSSFSEVAADIGNKELKILKLH